MKFSLWTFKEWFDRRGIELSYMINHTDAGITAISSSEQQMEDPVRCAAVLPGDSVYDISGFHSVLQYDRDRILFPTASPAEVWNLGNEMIAYYNDWEMTLLETVQNCHSLYDLFIAAQREFPFPFALLLKNGTVYQKTDDYDLELHEQAVQMIVKSAEKQTESEPVCRTFLFHPMQTILAVPVMSGQKPEAVLIAYQKGQRMQPGYFPVFQAIAGAIQRYLQFYAELPQAAHPLSGWFYQILYPDERPVSELIPRLEEARWHSDDYFRIFCIDAKAGFPPSVLQEISAQVRDASHCCIFVKNGLAVLEHLGSEYPAEPASFITGIRSIRECRVGISLVFHPLELAPDYFRQASWALHRAMLLGLDVLDIRTCLSEYLLEMCRDLPERRSLIHPDILRLAEADADKHDDLMHTLYTYYIYGHSVTRASEVLFIHRNTLRQRLNKISTFLSSDLDDPAAEKQYLLSLVLSIAE